MSIIIISLIEINIINQILKRIFINKILINSYFKILKNTFNNRVISFNKV